MLLVLLTGCDDNIFGPQGGGDCDATPSQDGLAGVEEIVQGNCLTCHGADVAVNSGNGLDLETDLVGATVGVQSSYGVPLVTPGDAENSLLYQKITGTNADGTGGQMPPGVLLCGGATDVVKAWINDGANP
jgi:mono/diheme cytochrome c family protein